jgi:hypothetical protein
MKDSRRRVRNSSSVSIRKAPVRRYATDTNEDEKVKIPKVSLAALRTIAGIVRAIKERLEPDPEDNK